MLTPILRETKCKNFSTETSSGERTWVDTGKVEVIVRPYRPAIPEEGLTVEVEYVRDRHPYRTLSAKIIGSVAHLTIDEAQALAAAINMAIGAAAARQLELFNTIYWGGKE